MMYVVLQIGRNVGAKLIWTKRIVIVFVYNKTGDPEPAVL